MTRNEAQELAVTDGVRQGNCHGIITEISASGTIKIAWDGQGRVPTSYPKDSDNLKHIVVTHRADRAYRDGRVIGWHTRP
jgi:hypothetical protein